MKTNFQVLDADYVVVDSKPLIRVFGRTDKNKSITVFYDKFSPYFYLLPEKGKTLEIKNHIKNNFKDLVVGIETVEKFLPIGYQKKPTKFLKITLNNIFICLHKEFQRNFMFVIHINLRMFITKSSYN